MDEEVRLDRTHQGKGSSIGGNRRQGICDGQCRMAETHGALRQVVVRFCRYVSGRAAKEIPRASTDRISETLMTIAADAAPLKAPQTSADHILALNNIEVVYDHVILVLKGVSLDVPRGGIVALLGANGAGKTTTLKAISNLLHAERGEVTKGSIIFDSHEVQRLSPDVLVK